MNRRTNIISDPLVQMLPEGYELVPRLSELYELRLALLEYQQLKKSEHISRLAYFSSLSEAPTYHYRICTSQRIRITTSGGKRKQFFQNNSFKTGYSTHGFFPYRGKFHPQMVKAILNLMGLSAGDVVLDPMMGSGTTLVEASSIGIDSIGVDVSPFCQFMSQAKCEGLRVDPEDLERTVSSEHKVDKLFMQFSNGGIIEAREKDAHPLRRISALAFMDACGLSKRSNRLTKREAFQEILIKYTNCLAGFSEVRDSLNLKLGDTSCMQGDARSLLLDSESVDGVLFSPPYSFAVDYVGNDEQHIASLGIHPSELRSSMVGLRGKKGSQQVLFYLEDVKSILNECWRVLRPGKFCCVIVGTNERQLEKLRTKPELSDLDSSLESLFIRMGTEAGFIKQLEITRPISGIANTMREEAIIILQKPLTSGNKETDDA